MDLWNLLEHAAARYPKRLAVRDGARTLTYAQWLRRCRSLATGLLSLRLEPGARIAILAENCEEYLSAYFAAAGAGLVLVPLNTRLCEAELAAIAETAGYRHVLGTGEWAFDGPGYSGLLATDGAAFRPIARCLDEPAQIYFTSGTTGRPKGVVLTHGNVLSHARMASTALDLKACDVWGHVAPLFHLADAWATFAITMVGGCHVTQARFEAGATLELISATGISITNLVPTMLSRLVKHPRAAQSAFPSLRMLLSGGAPIAPEVVREVLAVFGCEYAQTYGLTETSPFLTMSLLPEALRQLSAAEQLAFRAKTGRPLPGVNLRVVDPEGRDVAADGVQVGEILASGPTVTPGYWQDPEATATAFRNGWLHTGDLAVMDSEGFLNIVDRKKDVILSGGETVYSIEVENRLYEHPSVLEAAVYGQPDPDWGERVCAAVVLAPGCTVDADELTAFCRERLAGFKAPKELHLVEALPRSGPGKIQKRRLRNP